MQLADIVKCIPDDELEDIRTNSAILQELLPVDEGGQPVDWYDSICRDWWIQENTLPAGWFCYWE